MANVERKPLLIIGLTGAKQSGKSTVAQILSDDFHFKKLALADPIKAITTQTFGWNRAYMERHKDELDSRWFITPRFALQQIGEKFRRIFGEDIWAKLLVERLLNIYYKTNQSRFVITDVRYENEARWLQGLDLTSETAIWKVRNREAERIIDYHESEAYWQALEADDEVFNNANQVKLRSTVLSLVKTRLGLEPIEHLMSAREAARRIGRSSSSIRAHAMVLGIPQDANGRYQITPEQLANMQAEFKQGRRTDLGK